MCAALLLVVACGGAEYTGVGDVVSIDESRRHVTIRHDAIPGLMGAMTMRFPVASPAVLEQVARGAHVRFTLRRTGGELVLIRLTPWTGSGPVAARVGVHDHTPHHGGVVGMVDDLHLEALAAADGRVRLHLTDFWRNPLPPAGVGASVELELPDGVRRVPLEVAGGALEGAGPSLQGTEVTAHFELTVDGKPVEMDFVLPLAAGGMSAAGVPVRGCVPAARRLLTTGRSPRCTLDFARPVTVVTATPDGTTVLVAAIDLGVSAWRMPAGSLAVGFWAPPPLAIPGPEAPHPEAANAVAVSPDGSEAVVALEGRLIRHALTSGRVVRELSAPGGVLRDVAWAPDGARLLVTAFYDASAHLVRAEDGAELRRLPVDHEGAAVAFSPDGRLAAVGSERGAVSLFDLDAGGPPQILAGDAPVQALVFAGGRLVSGGPGGSLRVYDTASGSIVAHAAPGRPIARLAVDPSGRLAAIAAFDNLVRLHDLERGTEVERPEWHGSQVVGLAWAAAVLVSGDAEGRVALWDLIDLVSPAR